MIRNLSILITLMLILWAVNVTGIGSFQTVGEHAALAFGFILLASYVCGRIARRFKLPMITGYLLAGFFFGPSVLGKLIPELRILTPEILDDLSIFNAIALGLIAFNAGGELKLTMLRGRWTAIGLVSGSIFLAAMILLIPILFLLGPRFALFQALDPKGLLGAILIFSVIAVSLSPASVIALIVEYQAKGPLTTVILGVTIFMDVFVIALFSFTLILSKSLLGLQSEGSAMVLLLVVWEVLGSVGIGLALGYLMGQYMKYVGREMPLILLALAFIAMRLAGGFHLSGLLLCMSAGFYVENFTNRGDQLIEAIERYTLPVYVLFFTITGATLEIVVLAQVWPLVLLFVALRASALWVGATAASVMVKDPPEIRNNLWFGFLTQAGVSLGLAALIEVQLPETGGPIKTVIVAAVAINQIIGPIAFRFGLLRSGEGKST